MRWLNTVRGKLMAVVLLTTALALVVAGITMLTHDLSVYRQSWVSDLSTEASILALSTAPALAFDDHEVAQRNLSAMRARAAVLVAALYSPDGTLYASFVRQGASPPASRIPTAVLGTHISAQYVDLSQPVVFNAERLGTIYLRARYDLMGRITAYLSIFALVTLLSMLVALALSTALQKIITRPLDEMATVARQVVDRRDYSLRAHATTQDEIGLVVAAFNSMLDEVQSRARALEQSNTALTGEVADRQAAEEALREADRRKDEFLATLAHELRNPLAPIRHAVKLLEAPGANDRQRQWGREVIARQVQRMALLLDDLLDVSRITRGRLDLKKDYVELASLVASAVETARPLIDSKQHILQIELPTEPLELEVDPLRLSQALSNLLTNAAKYTDAQGQILLRVSLDAQRLTLLVKDSGIGLSPAAIPRLFEMFSQIDSAIDRAEGGLGIGLALVKGLVALHGGTVEARSSGAGHGSEFSIHLPRSVIISRRLTAEVEQSVVVTVAGPRGKVMVVDDNRDAADTLSLVLRMSGHEVLVGHSGKDALELGSREHPDAIILDIGMPDMTGYEAARRVRREAWGRQVLLVAVTGWGQEDDKEKARAAGFDRHLTKPIDPNQLEDVLTAFLAAAGRH
jgi:signal transduction histidine kinase/ActR/RegA family two-component response regulator